MFESTLRVCLFGGKIGWMENFGKKIGKKNFFGVCLVGWGRKKINCRVQVFSPQTHQKIFSKMEKKLGRGNMMAE